ncbi:uncharacterized protein PpBr36_10464 [Pyricularia pennisetigena]|uniref:uncharacterized protein n=1 Tax=Pyricularia pennisetigena TaxID=1578925 RepID=UPI001153D0DC|nr:uncharacterized protein PpBr36_10464 [Pyricularia pennisetigena]TLS21062.1 hypothetical protein PpBr36_10464 [Pyricularia pennisetigena]
MSQNEPLSRDICEQLMTCVMHQALYWLGYVSQEDILQDYFLSLPIDVENQKLEELANAPAYQIVGRLEHLGLEAEKLRTGSPREQNDSRNARDSATCDGLEDHGQTRARAEDSAMAMTRPDSSSSLFRVIPTSWPHQTPPAAGSASGNDAPAEQPSNETRPDVNSEFRKQVLVLVRKVGAEFIRRCEGTKAKQIEGYGHDIEQQSYNDVKTALLRGEMSPKVSYDWIRNIDEDDE